MVSSFNSGKRTGSLFATTSFYSDCRFFGSFHYRSSTRSVGMSLAGRFNGGSAESFDLVASATADVRLFQASLTRRERTVDLTRHQNAGLNSCRRLRKPTVKISEKFAASFYCEGAAAPRLLIIRSRKARAPSFIVASSSVKRRRFSITIFPLIMTVCTSDALVA